MSYEMIIYEKREGVAIVILNRPEKKNAINSKMRHELVQVVDEIEKDDDVKVMILTGGAECFCSGVDLSEAKESKTGVPERTVGPSPFEKVRDMNKPTIAAISGFCVAGGMELALTCDILVASETARIGDRHIKIGLIGKGGSPTRIPRLIGRSKAMELILTGDLVDAKDAFQFGIVNHVYSKDKLMDEAMTMAKKIAANPPIAVRLTKKAVDAACDMDEYQSNHNTGILVSELHASEEFTKRATPFLQKGK